MNLPVKKIEPETKRNGLALTLFGIGFIILLAVLRTTGAPLEWPLFLALFGFGAVTTVLGIAKLAEPPTSMEITPETIRYIHPKGSWWLYWDDLQQFNMPTIHRGPEPETLPFLGFRLRSYERFMAELSPRMAVHLLMEQRQLMTVAVRSEKPEHREYTEYYESPQVYKTSEGHTYRGVYAAFAARMEHMRELLGYDIYISQNAFDRGADEFRQMLQELNKYRQDYLQSESGNNEMAADSPPARKQSEKLASPPTSDQEPADKNR